MGISNAVATICGFVAPMVAGLITNDNVSNGDHGPVCLVKPLVRLFGILHSTYSKFVKYEIAFLKKLVAQKKASSNPQKIKSIRYVTVFDKTRYDRNFY